MAQPRISGFQFADFDTLGAEDAEHDHEYLNECFIDSGALAKLQDTTSLPSIVVGRTGAGKSALLLRLHELNQNNSVLLDPASLSLHYLMDNSILKTLTRLDVRLDFFYKVLWNHILVVELIRLKFPFQDRGGAGKVLEVIRNLFSYFVKSGRGKGHDPVKYLEQWGDSFWEKTEYRIRETTEKFESKVRGSLGSKVPGLDTKLDASATLTGEQKADVINLAQEVVNSIQISELDSLLKFVKEDLFNNSQQKFYIIVDKLDTDWVEDIVRYKLIRSLMDSVLEFAKVQGVKIVVALRQDLVERVFKNTTTSGTQKEKYASFYLDIVWKPDHLMKIADKRIARLVKNRYTSRPVTWTDVMVERVGKEPTQDYLINRTFLRPRDLIVFLNLCVKHSRDQQTITAQAIREAELDYSISRIEAVRNEWWMDYPDLSSFEVFLANKRPTFRVGSIDEDFVKEKCLEIATDSRVKAGPLKALAQRVAEDDLRPEMFRSELLSVMYHVGLVGLKKVSTKVSWSFLGDNPFQPNAIKEDTSVSICPAFYRALDIREKQPD